MDNKKEAETRSTSAAVVVTLGDGGATDKVEFQRPQDLTLLGSKRSSQDRTFASAHELSVMSYNVLSDLLMKRHTELYTRVKEEDLDWDIRWGRITKEIEEYSPDVLCLQEVQVDHWESHFVPTLTRLGYSGVYKQRTGDDKRDGCALFYRAGKLSLLSHHAVEFCQPDLSVLDRDNVAVMAKFQHKVGEQSQPFVVATTHVLFNRRRTDIKLSQLAVFFADLDSFAREESSGHHLPVILTGDFNMTPDNPIVSEFVQRGGIEYRDHIHQSYRLPRKLGITDYCQHAGPVSLLRNNQRPLVTCQPISMPIVGSNSVRSSVQDTSEQQKVQQQLNNPSLQGLFDTGCLRNPFGFRSVYRNVPGNEASSHQGRDQYWVVDYIFYSTVFNPSYNKHVEGRLKLVSRLRLPSEKQCRDLGGLPNPACPSDHICLVAKFILT